MTRRRTSPAYLTVILLVLSARAGGQTPNALSARSAAARSAILTAEDRRAPTVSDVATIRAGLNSRDAQTARIAVRAYGRLERPSLIVDILPLLGHLLPEVRAEAANAIGQAAQGWKNDRTPGKPPPVTLDLVSVTLVARLNLEVDPNVRAVLGETLGRMPYTSAAQVERATQALLELSARSQSVADRLGIARGLWAIVRLHGKLSSPTKEVLESLRVLAIGSTAQSRDGIEPVARASASGSGSLTDPARNARVRRVAMEALIAAEAADDLTVRRAAGDPDGQVRRLAMRALSNPRTGSSRVAEDVLTAGLADPSPMVRLGAVQARRLRARMENPEPGSGGLRESACDAAMSAVRDSEPHVMLTALDQLADCSTSEAAVVLLERTVSDLSQAASPRNWHRAAHAIVALASAAPEKAADALGRFVVSPVWQLRMYGARAAAILAHRPALEKLAQDDEDNVTEAAILGLNVVAGHGADAIYIAALEREGYQVVRSAAAGLAGTQAPEAAAALKAALQRLVIQGHDDSRDARTAMVETLRGLGADADPAMPVRVTPATAQLDAADVPRLMTSRARVSIRGVGSFELALIASEAPLSAFRFARLVELGYYNGLTFHRVVPNFVVQGGSPGANEYIGDATFMRDEVGQWPHVRGSVGISTRGRDTGDAQIFIDLLDNPSLDHDYTVFAHVLNGMDVVDAILEGDVIDKIELVVGR